MPKDSQPRDLVIIGAGGFGRETVEAVRAINNAAATPVWNLLGVVDDGPSVINLERLRGLGHQYMGTTADLCATESGAMYVVGIGSPAIRRKIAQRLDRAKFQAGTLVHPDATVGEGVAIGAGSVILAGVRLTTNITLGKHVHLNPNVTVGHDSLISDFVSMNPASSLSGDCVVEEGVLIGVQAVILNNIRVGNGSIVGAAACVVREVPAGTTVKGVPAS